MKPILVTAYVNADVDGVAGAMAYAEFLNYKGISAIAGIVGEPHDEAKYILNRFNIEYPLILNNADDYDQVILVDASDLNGLEGKIDPEKVIEIIDHRKIHEAEKFPNAKTQIEMVGAAATLVAEKFINENIPISQNSAILLYGAIVSNTLNFKNTTNTQRDIDIANWLKDQAKLDDNFWKELFIAKSDLTGKKLQDRMDSEIANFDFGGKRLGIVQLEIIGARELVKNREEEILEKLEEIKKELNLDLIFLTIPDLELEINIFVTNNSEMKNILESTLNVTFINNIAERSGFIMRKQITPLLKEYLEK